MKKFKNLTGRTRKKTKGREKANLERIRNDPVCSEMRGSKEGK